MYSQKSRHDVFRGIADPTRREILKLLAINEMSISSLTDHFPLSRNAVNKHLFILLDANLVTKKKAGRETRYSLTPEPLIKLKEWLSFFDQYWEEKLNSLKEYVETED